MVQYLSSSDPKVAAVVKAVRSRKRRVSFAPYSAGSTVLLGWDGGSREEYYVVWGDYSVSPLETQQDPNRMGDPWGHRHVLPPFPHGAVAVVRMGTFNGKPATPQIQYRPW